MQYVPFSRDRFAREGLGMRVRSTMF
jgi:hypothetical protein